MKPGTNQATHEDSAGVGRLGTLRGHGSRPRSWEAATELTLGRPVEGY